MKMEGTIYCEGPDCEVHAHLGVDTMEAGRLLPSFLRLIEYGSRDHEYAFCSADCLMKWAAQRPPTEVIPAGPEDSDG